MFQLFSNLLVRSPKLAEIRGKADQAEVTISKLKQQLQQLDEAEVKINQIMSNGREINEQFNQLEVKVKKNRSMLDDLRLEEELHQ